MMTSHTFIPALGHEWLTRIYDPAMATIFQERLFRKALIDALDLQPGQNILDIGCGTGTASLLLQEHAPAVTITGLDIDPAVLTIAQRKIAQRQAQLPLSLASADCLPYANNSFDHVMSSLMLHHLTTTQKQKMLAEAWRVLRAGGVLSVLDFGPPRATWQATVLKRLASSFEHVDDNLYGRVPGLFEQAEIVDVHVQDIAFGGLIKLYQGLRRWHQSSNTMD